MSGNKRNIEKEFDQLVDAVQDLGYTLKEMMGNANESGRAMKKVSLSLNDNDESSEYATKMINEMYK